MRRIVRAREFSERLFGPGKRGRPKLSSLYSAIAKGRIKPGEKILGGAAVGWTDDYVDAVVAEALAPEWQSLGNAATRVVSKLGAKP